MIDLHCHLLPGLDDGACDMAVSVAMARMAHADGVRGIVCTPHVKPGVYENDAAGIAAAVRSLREQLAACGIRIELFCGADVHVAPDLGGRLRRGEVPTIAGSRYFLLEPPHHIPTPRMVNFVLGLIAQGYVPIVTHPERLTWLSSRYDVLEQINDAGCLVQLTAGSVIGQFGRTAKYYAERMLDEGRIDILASDAHDTVQRPPLLARARDIVAARLGEEEAKAMVLWRPAAILANRLLRPRAARNAPPLAVQAAGRTDGQHGLLQRLFGTR